MSVMTGYAGDFATFRWYEKNDAGGIDLRRMWPHPVSYDPKPVHSAAVSERLRALTDAQRDCLRLVYGHMTSKDIARALGVSPHTVDMRLRTAMKTLGVGSRIEAARALVDAEGGTEVYQPLIYQAPDVAGVAETGIMTAPVSTTSDEYATQHSDPRFSSDFDPPASGPPRLAGASLPYGDDSLVAGGPQVERSHPAPLADVLPWGARNTLTPGVRLAWIAVIAIGSSLGFGAILGALQALKTLL